MSHESSHKRWFPTTIAVAALFFNAPYVNSQVVDSTVPQAVPAPAQGPLRPVETLSDDALIEKYKLPIKTPGEKMPLTDALKKAEDRNLSLQSMKAEIAIAQGRLKTAWGGVLPIIQGKMGYTVFDHEDTMQQLDAGGNMVDIVTNPQHDVNGGIEAVVPLIDPKAWYGIKVAKKSEELTHMNVESVRQQVLLNVAEAYFACLMAEKLIDIHISTLKSFDYSRNIAASRFSAGAGLRIDVIRAETDIETARQQLISANLFFDNTRDVLARLTESEGLPLPIDAGAVTVPEQDNETLEKIALESRPDIQAARAGADLQRLQIKESYMQFLPYITAAWSGTYQFTEPGDMAPDDRSRMAAVFSLVVPIYDHYRYGDVDTKRAQVRKSELEILDAERNATLAVRKARRDYEAALASQEAAEKQAALSKEALTLTEASYSAGTGNSLEVTDARRTALEADVNYATLVLESQTALLQLLFAIGQDMITLGK